jgi:putative phage-type endonuclease
VIIHDVEQRSPEWFALRRGIPTASAFDRLITPTGKASTQIDGLALEIVAEWLTGSTDSIEATPYMTRGVEMEPEARAWFELESGLSVREVGFVTTDDRKAGCSPDGWHDQGLVEIKVPKPGTHVEYLIGGGVPSKYVPQVQGQLWVCEADYCDFISYLPARPECSLFARVGRDEAFIAALAARVDRLHEIVEDHKAALRARGFGGAE